MKIKNKISDKSYIKYYKKPPFLLSKLSILFLSLLLLLFLSSCTTTQNQVKIDLNEKIYDNSFYIDVKIPESVVELNTINKINFTINENKYPDLEYSQYETFNSNINIDSIKIHYQLFLPENLSGENKIKGKFLLVHGFAGSSFSFNRLAPLLASSGFLVVAMDLPNFGYSQRVKLKLNSNCFADLINNFLVQFDNQFLAQNIAFNNINKEIIDIIIKEYPTKWNIVGHSMAGRILTVFSYKYKNLVSSISLISPAFFSSKPYSIFTKLPPFNLLLYLYVSSALKKDNFAKLLEKVYFRKPEEFEIENYLKPLLIPKTIEYVMYMLDTPEDLNFDPPKLLDKLPFNLLLIWGKKDQIVPLKNSMKLVDKIKEKNLFIIDDAGHNSMETHAEMVFEEILKNIE